MARRSLLVAAAACAALAGCSLLPASEAENPPESELPPPTQTTAVSPKPSATAKPAAEPDKPITLAFAGDIHFADQLRERLDDPDTALEPIAPALSDADLTVVNLETAIATGGTPEDKNYTFRTPPSALDALQAAGVDVVTMANNHGVDYGRTGLEESLDAKHNGPIDVIGIGEDDDEAFAPAIHDIRGTKIAVIGATAFPLDPTVENWPAGPGEAGIAVAIDPERLLEEVREVRSKVDVVITYLHWGTERESCPNASQRELASELEEAGVDLIVGAHAHVLQGAGRLGDAFVAYGFGNFVWYSQNTPREATTGVMKVTLDGRKVSRMKWTPAYIQSSGVPEPATGSRKEDMISDFADLRDCTGLDPVPGVP
jgi:poly-gamma-glutamate capsule biosynthesis protein CapA/YwtB (metallophosphatase superfamily)